MPLQTQNYSCDVDKVIPDLYSWMQGALLGCVTFPQQRAAPQGRAFPLSPHSADTSWDSHCEIKYSHSHSKMQLKHPRQQNR